MFGTDGTMYIVYFIYTASKVTEQTQSKGQGDKSPSEVKKDQKNTPLMASKETRKAITNKTLIDPSFFNC